ncbi:dTDP-4-dehydrorhamnose 3,5-epimerase [Dyella sp. OK004]|uniref:dTDP-4-dehydrorhamnose 3,5-epimerase n=1 Tax=Dyella sp. OK004 TaxID=1855292 RepID=UPI0008F36A46|nr:dTDP-4-dehydrorhamnose 3,5-epimerase [Dyella sp. OK004]SFS05861.1 dTDP-4-dehydrorhamnose 3,5-epimerase [Dyella sp. OK004]
MKFRATPLSGLMLIETTPIQDERGRFLRLFCETELAPIRPDLHFPQVNLSTTFQRGSVRGMHFQWPPAAEAKLIRCVRGRVFDVAVDLRSSSPTFLQWHGVELTEDNQTQVFIPEGFAHGFQAMSDNVELLYMHTASWSRDHEGGLRPNDPRLAISWPLPIAQVSERDRSAPVLNDSFTGIQL